MFATSENVTVSPEQISSKKSRLQQLFERIKNDVARTGHILFGDPTPDARAELKGRLASLVLGPAAVAVVVGQTSGERAAASETEAGQNEEAADVHFDFFLEQYRFADYKPEQPYGEFLAQNLSGVGISFIDGLRDQILEEGFNPGNRAGLSPGRNSPSVDILYKPPQMNNPYFLRCQFLEIFIQKRHQFVDVIDVRGNRVL